MKLLTLLFPLVQDQPSWFNNPNNIVYVAGVISVIMILIIVFFLNWFKSRVNNEDTLKANSSSKSKKINFDNQYVELDEMMLSGDSYQDVYPFIKTFREKLKNGDIYLEQINKYIKNHYGKYDGGKIMYQISLFEQMEHIFGVFLNEWEKKNDSNFIGFQDIEQYHTLSQKTIITLQELLQEKILDVGRK